MEISRFDSDRDTEAVIRVWEECGWIEEDDDGDKAAMGHFIDAGTGFVARLDDRAECSVTTMPGQLRYAEADLDLEVVTSVTTSHIGRKQGLARGVTAAALRAAVERGAVVSALGMFEQGFYDLLGFGTGSYSHHTTFDPASLRISQAYRPPVRLGPDDWQEIHDCLLSRAPHHGRVTIDPAGFTRAQMAWCDAPFGLGFRDEAGSLTHLLWGGGKGDSGPYKVELMAYRSGEQLLDLLNVIASLGDQVRSITMAEPPGIQLQDLLTHVARQEIATKGSTHAFTHESGAWWQLRILDLPACIGARRVDGPPLRFLADISDPMSGALGEGWAGTAGRYIVEIGEHPSATPGDDARLPVLTATINAFSRMWLGVRPASSLALTDALDGPVSLLADLDRAFADLPDPQPGLDF